MIPLQNGSRPFLSKHLFVRYKTARKERIRRHRKATISCSREVSLLDYGAGNVRSVRNAIKKLGFTVKEVFLLEKLPI